MDWKGVCGGAFGMLVDVLFLDQWNGYMGISFVIIQ